MDDPVLISRRRFHSLAGSALALTASSALAQGPQSQLGTASTKHTPMLPTPRTIKCLNCDLNWARAATTRPATAADWANLDPQEYFDYHRRFGNNMLFFQAYNAAGFCLLSDEAWPRCPETRRAALAPTLEPVAAGKDAFHGVHVRELRDRSGERRAPSSRVAHPGDLNVRSGVGLDGVVVSAAFASSSASSLWNGWPSTGSTMAACVAIIR